MPAASQEVPPGSAMLGSVHDGTLDPYLNRPSGLLFVMARAANDDGKGDVLWAPGQDR